MESQLKQFAISFSQLYFLASPIYEILDKSKKASASQKKEAKEYIQLLEFLSENKIAEIYLNDPNTSVDVTPDLSIHKHADRITEAIAKYPITRWDGIDDQTFAITILAIIDAKTRINARFIEKEKNIQVFPILSSVNSFLDENPKSDILFFTLNKMPVPNANVSWQQIFEFRSDKDVQSSYFALINWINNVAKSNKTLSEIDDEFNYLYDQYFRHYRLHKMKSKSNTLEILVSLGIDALTAIEPVNGLIKNLFTIRKNKIALMEEELKLPGSEIAYIYKANETFG